MTHFDTICSLLQHTHRNLSDTQVKKLGKLKHHRFQKAKKEFIFPLDKLIEMSQVEPVTLIMDYVLVGRNTNRLTFPFNFVFNYNSKRLEPTLFILFLLAKQDDQLYPISLEFWGQEEWAMDDGIYLTKLDIASAQIQMLLSLGLEVKELLFDAGFCSRELLEILNELDIPYICRFPSNRKVESHQQFKKPEETFQDNSLFHYDRHKSLYIAAQEGLYANHEVKLVAIANSRERLDLRDYYCLITNQLNLKHTQVYRHYLNRGLIENFFRDLKSYLGLCAFCRHHPDNNLIPFFQMRCAGYVILQAFAKELKKTTFQALEVLRQFNTETVQEKLSKHWDEWGQSLINIATHESNTPLSQVATV